MERLWKSVRKHPVLYSSGLIITLGVSAYSIYLLKRSSEVETENGQAKDQSQAENEQIDEQESEELKTKFEQISGKMKTQNLPLSEEQQLLLYSLFKQATAGKCNTKKPAVWDLVGLAKWESWNKLGAMKKDEAKKEYIALALSLSPKLLEQEQTEIQAASSESEKKSKVMGPVFSTAMSSSAEKEETSTDVWGFARDGEDQKLSALLNQGEDVNSTDENGRTALHWACDRGHLSIVKILLDKGAKINIQDCEGRTALHFAVDCLFEEIISELLARGALFLRDNDGQKPTDGVDDQHIKKLLENHIQNSRKTISGEDSKSFQQEKNAKSEETSSDLKKEPSENDVQKEEGKEKENQKEKEEENQGDDEQETKTS